MISEEDIKEWWERKIKNYIKIYTRWNKLSFAQSQEFFLQRLTKNFLRAFHKHFKNYCKDVHDPTTTSTVDAHTSKRLNNQFIRVG